MNAGEQQACRSLALQAVGTLLMFSDAAHEAAFRAKFARRRLRPDCSMHKTTMALTALVCRKGCLHACCWARQVAAAQVPPSMHHVQHHTVAGKPNDPFRPCTQGALLPAGDGNVAGVAASLAQAVLAGALLLLAHRRPSPCCKWRSPLVAAALVWHATVRPQRAGRL